VNDYFYQTLQEEELEDNIASDKKVDDLNDIFLMYEDYIELMDIENSYEFDQIIQILNQLNFLHIQIQHYHQEHQIQYDIFLDFQIFQPTDDNLMGMYFVVIFGNKHIYHNLNDSNS
jgi:hypothetical protein